MITKGLTATFIIEAESANYGEGIGNISVLKKMTRGGGTTNTYISRQALRYSIIEQLQWTNTPLTDLNTVVQFSSDATIDNYPEVDLFGYMKTASGKGATTRPAVARLSNAISLEPYRFDTDYLTNMGLSKRIGAANAIAQREIQHSLYSYTMTIDLDRVGVDNDLQIPMEERANRVGALLEALQFLYRDIAGRRENLSPVFAIGGVYERKNPYFENRAIMKRNTLSIEPLKETIASCKDANDNTICGILSGLFDNEADIRTQLNALTISDFFAKLTAAAAAVYNG